MPFYKTRKESQCSYVLARDFLRTDDPLIDKRSALLSRGSCIRCCEEKRVYGPGGLSKEVDAAAIAEGCALVAEHKHVMSIKGVEQLLTLIAFIK